MTYQTSLCIKTTQQWRNRLVKRIKNCQWFGAVHKYLKMHGRVLNSDIGVSHKDTESDDSDRNLKIHEKGKARGKSSPKDLFNYANELSNDQLYKQAAEAYLEFLQTGEGWVEDNLSACGKLADSFDTLGEKDKELEYILKSFEYATPRAEFCCRLGYYFLCAKQYDEGIFWYKLATQLEKPTDRWDSMIEACWTWLPHLQLCVCYDHLKKHELAYEHNEIARKYCPENPQILYNKNYLEGVLGSCVTTRIDFQNTMTCL